MALQLLFNRARPALLVALLMLALSWPSAPSAQAAHTQGAKTATHTQSVQRLLIQHAMVIPGTATPAYGPVDILVENGLITRIGDAAQQKWPAAEATMMLAVSL